jgi:hypothetical protein
MGVSEEVSADHLPTVAARSIDRFDAHPNRAVSNDLFDPQRPVLVHLKVDHSDGSLSRQCFCLMGRHSPLRPKNYLSYLFPAPVTQYNRLQSAILEKMSDMREIPVLTS